MDEQKQKTEMEEKDEDTEQKMSPTWAHDCIEDLDDWIESQGIYLRQ